MNESDPTVQAAAAALREAARTKHFIAPLREQYPQLDAAQAYAIQRANTQHRLAAGARLVGAKVGLTSRNPEFTMSKKLKAAIIGSGNIGTDLMIKILRHGVHLEMGAMVGIDAASDGLARAARLGVATTHEGVQGLTRLPVFDDIDVVFDATSAGAHVKNDAFLRALKPGVRMIDLTPAAIGPYCIPVVNGEDHLEAPNVNMVTCGGQATIPMVAAVSRVAKVHYAEIVDVALDLLKTQEHERTHAQPAMSEAA